MKKFICSLVACLGLTAATVSAQNEALLSKNDSIVRNVLSSQALKPISPTYLDGVYRGAGWDSNWFFSLQGGANAFVGNPTGCGDIGDRISPVLNASIGKWMNPYIGARVSFQGLKFKDSELRSVGFQNIHADFLYDVSSHFRKEQETLPRWDCIPYVGLGIIRNDETDQKPFALSYGLIGRYRLTKRLHLTGEIGGTTTFRDFDKVGEPRKFGDNLIHASIGLTCTLGKVGWKKVIDAKPYMNQNDLLMNSLAIIRTQNDKLAKALSCDDITIMEMKKILKIEGLLGKYNLVQGGGTATVSANPRNNYSGLNSLRARLRNRNWNGNPDDYKPMLASIGSTKADTLAYLDNVRQGRTHVGAPVFFFFQFRTANLTNQAQKLNIKTIAGVMKKYGLHAKVIGAADAKTGSAKTNERLSRKRAETIKKLLEKHGIDGSVIQVKYRGGVDNYLPNEANRNTCVLLYMK